MHKDETHKEGEKVPRMENKTFNDIDKFQFCRNLGWHSI